MRCSQVRGRERVMCRTEDFPIAARIAGPRHLAIITAYRNITINIAILPTAQPLQQYSYNTDMIHAKNEVHRIDIVMYAIRVTKKAASSWVESPVSGDYPPPPPPPPILICSVLLRT